MGIHVERDDETATITIDNPERKNAVTPEMCVDLADAVRDVSHDDSVRCVVLTGAGDAFCSGLDLSAGLDAGGVMEELEQGLNAVATGLLRMEKPTVAKVPGAAVGAGASIATACDFVYPVAGATFGWGFTNIGLAPDTGATYVLPRLVGTRKAIELLTTGERIPAQEAVDLGIANEVVASESFDDVVADRVEMLASRPTKAVGAASRLVYRNSSRSFEEALHEEGLVQEQMIETEDFMEGVTAFTEGREPEFEGR